MELFSLKDGLTWWKSWLHKSWGKFCHQLMWSQNFMNCVFICTCLHCLLFMSFDILESALLCRRRVGLRKNLARIQETKVQFLSQAYWENVNKSLPPSLVSRLLLSKIQVMKLSSFLRSSEIKNIKSTTARNIFSFFITKTAAYKIPTRHQCDTSEGTRWET